MVNSCVCTAARSVRSGRVRSAGQRRRRSLTFLPDSRGEYSRSLICFSRGEKLEEGEGESCLGTYLECSVGSGLYNKKVGCFCTLIYILRTSALESSFQVRYNFIDKKE